MDFNLTYLGVFTAGLVSFITPCVLPLVLPYICYVAGLSLNELTAEDRPIETTRKVVTSSIFFVAGFTTIFVAMGASASLIGGLLVQYWHELSIIAGVILIIMGLTFLGLFKIGFLKMEFRLNVEMKSVSYAGAFVIGLAFAFGWTSCVGPILAGILMIAGSEGTLFYGAFLLFLYAMGMGLPFILVSVFSGPFVVLMQRFRPYMGIVEKVMGGALVLTGIAFIRGDMRLFAEFLIETFPVFQTIG